MLIHDLDEIKFSRIKDQYTNYKIISAYGNNHPCTGCFSCWTKTPGQCVIKDDYADMGKNIHEADEVTIISRYTFGGFSGAIKNIFDRCLAYVLPYFEVSNGESHHQKRYKEDKAFTFIFYGHNLSEHEKDSARLYVKAVCANFRSHVKDVIFKEDEDYILAKTDTKKKSEGKVVLLNPSVRYIKGNSAKFLNELNKLLKTETEIINLQQYTNNFDELYKKLYDASAIVLCMPLYVDGMPSQMIRFLEKYLKEYDGGIKKIYGLVNMGLYENRQLKNILEMIKQFSEIMHFEYCGSLGISAGELIGPIMDMMPLQKGPGKGVYEGMLELANHINNKEKMDDIYKSVRLIPRWLFIKIANISFNLTGKRNGLKPIDLRKTL